MQGVTSVFVQGCNEKYRKDKMNRSFNIWMIVNKENIIVLFND